MSSGAGGDGKWSARFPVYQIEFTSVAAGKRIATSKRRIRWRFGFSDAEAIDAGKTGTACRGPEHDVTVVWSISSGKRLILADGHEVHYSTVRSNVLEYSWTMRGNHVLRVLAHATPPGGNEKRQYDLSIDGQSFYHMPKVYELGIKGPASAVARKPGFISPAERSEIPPPVGGDINAPRSKKEEQADLQKAIQASIEESRQHLERASVKGDKKTTAASSTEIVPAPVPVAEVSRGIAAGDLLDFGFDSPAPAPAPSGSLVSSAPAPSSSTNLQEDPFFGALAPVGAPTQEAPVPASLPFDVADSAAAAPAPTAQTMADPFGLTAAAPQPVPPQPAAPQPVDGAAPVAAAPAPQQQVADPFGLTAAAPQPAASQPVVNGDPAVATPTPQPPADPFGLTPAPQPAVSKPGDGASPAATASAPQPIVDPFAPTPAAPQPAASQPVAPQGASNPFAPQPAPSTVSVSQPTPTDTSSQLLGAFGTDEQEATASKVPEQLIDVVQDSNPVESQVSAEPTTSPTTAQVEQKSARQSAGVDSAMDKLVNFDDIFGQKQEAPVLSMDPFAETQKENPTKNNDTQPALVGPQPTLAQMQTIKTPTDKAAIMEPAPAASSLVMQAPQQTTNFDGFGQVPPPLNQTPGFVAGGQMQGPQMGATYGALFVGAQPQPVQNQGYNAAQQQMHYQQQQQSQYTQHDPFAST